MDGKSVFEPASWLMAATDIHKVAMLIADKIRMDFERLEQDSLQLVFSEDDLPYLHLGGVFWMNAGLVLENLLKGIIVKKHPDLVTARGLDKRLTIHKMIRLCRLADFEITPIEGHYLWVAEECVVWAGRYPSIKAGERTKPPVFSSADIDMYCYLHSRLLTEYSDVRRKTRRFERLVL